jgi:NAD(P)H-nitrite reductase large subunit
MSVGTQVRIEYNKTLLQRIFNQPATIETYTNFDRLWYRDQTGEEIGWSKSQEIERLLREHSFKEHQRRNG